MASESGQLNQVALVGLMGAGKTTVGKILAQNMGWRFVDSDREVERKTGVTIPVIFDLEGEEGFRRRESQALEEALASDGVVLATGGGIVLSAANRAILRNVGLVVYIDVSPELLCSRTRRDRNRPLLQVEDPLARLRQLFAERDPYYREVADIVVDGNHNHARQVASKIEKEVHLRCGR